MAKHNDRVRQALRRLTRVGTLFEDDFTRYTEELLRLGREIFDCEAAFFSQVDPTTYYVRGISGMTNGIRVGDELPIADTLCAAIIAADQPLALDDLSGEDAACHPALPAEAFGRYIGVPLSIDGELYGTLSFSGSAPRTDCFTEDDIDLISLMALGLISRIRLEKTQSQLRQSQEEMELILDHIPTRIWFKDDQNRVLRANRTAAQSVGFNDPETLVGADTYELFPKNAAKFHGDDLKVLATGSPMLNVIERATPRNGEEKWISTNKIPLRLLNGERALLVAVTEIDAPNVLSTPSTQSETATEGETQTLEQTSPVRQSA